MGETPTRSTCATSWAWTTCRAARSGCRWRAWRRRRRRSETPPRTSKLRRECRRLGRDLEAGQPLVNVPPALVRQSGAELADGHELVCVSVVDTREQGARAELCPLALAEVVAQQDDVDGVVQPAARVALQLHPVE